MALKDAKCFCSITTSNYLPNILALNESIREFDASFEFNLLISDKNETFLECRERYPNIEFHSVDAICQDGVAKEIHDQYWASDIDCFRWSMFFLF